MEEKSWADNQRELRQELEQWEKDSQKKEQEFDSLKKTPVPRRNDNFSFDDAFDSINEDIEQ